MSAFLHFRLSCTVCEVASLASVCGCFPWLFHLVTTLSSRSGNARESILVERMFSSGATFSKEASKQSRASGGRSHFPAKALAGCRVSQGVAAFVRFTQAILKLIL